MAGKRGGAGRASPRAAKARRADDPAVAAARRAALDGELDETTALRLFLAGGDRGRCGRTCKGNAKRVDCVCGLVPPVGGFRRTGLWRRDTDAAVREAVGVNPSTLARASHAVPVGLRNLGNTCYVNAAIQCVFAIPSFRARVLALDPADDPSVADAAGAPRGGGGDHPAGADEPAPAASPDVARASATPGDDEDDETDKNATAALRSLFASMVAGDRAVADPRRFADALSLETAAQQDGQEFLKLLLAYLDAVAARKAGTAETDANDESGTKSGKLASVAEPFRGRYAYVTTCGRCGRASEASSREVDFYELELNVVSACAQSVNGAAAGRDAESDDLSGAGKKKPFGLRDALGEFLAVERLEGDNRYACAHCGILTDATRAVRLRRLPRYLAFQLKRFVFDFETFERRKCADAFQFPHETRLGHLETSAEAPAGDAAGTKSGGTKSGAYALQSILLHRGQNATSGHYVALVRAEGAPSKTDGGASAEPSAPTREKTEESVTEKTEAASDAWWRFDDEEVTALRGGPFGEPVVKGKDGWTLGPGSYASSDAYLLVYKRVDDDEDARAENLEPAESAAGHSPALPPDLAAAVARENAALAAMVATFASRVEEARARLETRKAHARRVAEMARLPGVRLGDDDEPTNAEHPATDRNRNDADERPRDVLASESPDAYRFVPRAWLERFCDDTHDPGPMDMRPVLCVHGAVDPNKAEAVVRVSTKAFEYLVECLAECLAEPHKNAPAPRVCRRCLRASAALFAGEDAEVTARAEARARLEAWERRERASAKHQAHQAHQASEQDGSSVPGTHSLLDVSASADAPFLVSAAWLKKWRAWRRGPPPPALTKEGPTFVVTCVHGALKPNANVARVDRETWSFLVQNPPAAPRAKGRKPDDADAVIELDADGEARVGARPGDVPAAAAAGAGGGGGGGGVADLLEPDTVFASNAETPAVDVEITGDTDRRAARLTAAADPAGAGPDALEPESSPARWPVHLASAEACAACVSFRIEAAAAKSSTRELAEIHRAACAALRDPLDPDATRLGGGAEDEENGKNETETSAPFRALPRRWLARWRAFAFAKGAARAPGAPGGASTAWRPSLSSLREAADGLFCPHGGLAAPGDLYRPRGSDENGVADDDDAAALDAEKTRALRAIFGDGPPTAHTDATHERTSTGDDETRLQLELVPAAAAAALEATLGGRVRAPGCFQSGGAWAFTPAACAACASATEGRRKKEETPKVFPSAVARIPPYVSQAISVRRVRVSPATFARAVADRAKAIGAKRARPHSEENVAPAPAHAEHLALSDHGSARAPRERATTRRGRVVGPASEEKQREAAPRAGAAALPRLDPVGRACSLVVDHDYTVWRVKLLLLEKLAIHPLDMSLFYATYRHDDKSAQELDELEASAARGGPDAAFELENAQTLREAGVPAGARLALFATARRDPDDLAGLEMPLGPVAWETDGGGGEAGVGAVGGSSARERGFAGTGLAGGPG